MQSEAEGLHAIMLQCSHGHIRKSGAPKQGRCPCNTSCAYHNKLSPQSCAKEQLSQQLGLRKTSRMCHPRPSTSTSSGALSSRLLCARLLSKPAIDPHVSSLPSTYFHAFRTWPMLLAAPMQRHPRLCATRAPDIGRGCTTGAVVNTQRGATKEQHDPLNHFCTSAPLTRPAKLENAPHAALPQRTSTWLAPAGWQGPMLESACSYGSP